MFQFVFFCCFFYLLGGSIPQHPWNSLSSGFFKLLRVANHQKLYGKVASTLQKKMLWKIGKSQESLMLESCASNVSGVCHFRRNVPTFFGTTIWQNTSDFVLEKALRFFNKALWVHCFYWCFILKTVFIC